VFVTNELPLLAIKAEQVTFPVEHLSPFSINVTSVDLGVLAFEVWFDAQQNLVLHGT
jgi:hypothetical protein